MSKDGSNYTRLFEFDRPDGFVVHSGLVRGSDRALYGTARVDGKSGIGVVFRMVTDTDDDGHDDTVDNCPYVLNPDQKDTNGNGVGTSCDIGMPTTPTIAQIQSPKPGVKLGSASVTFRWTQGTGVTQYRLKVGSKQGTGTLFDRALSTSLSVTVNGLPKDGRKLYVRLMSWKQGRWLWNDYVYTATGSSLLVSAP
jgi:hypothetical protein